TGDIIAAQAAAAGLSVTDRETFGASYARTLAEWRRRFNAAWQDIAPLGFDEPFRRLWNYYLGYCEVGFSTQALDVALYKIEH
ncbi:class I SAM-dependent methyltransferase, partial [Klebsiella pneumoniae]|uniref:class I SAM-dependent methyltransferase n=1 Tax=Klebsiella pneumoniae TaxID=573 RepID=UPI0027E44DC0